MAQIDHLVVAAPNLADGRWITDTLGVPAQPGGKHPDFGTHNVLLSLGDCYLEVIAIDPDAPAPDRPRWFGLDEIDLDAGPRLIHWVVAVDDLEVGPEVPELSRGDNRWRLTVPADGSLPGEGVAPSLIHWLTPPPAGRLPDAGVRLVHLELTTQDPDALAAELARIGLSDDRVQISAGAPALRATMNAGGRPVQI